MKPKQKWRITVTAKLHPYDDISHVGGQYEVLADSEMQALDKFHRAVQITKRDDFEIVAELMTGGRPRKPGRVVTVKLEERHIERASDLGEGNVSKGIRKALS